MCHAGVAATHSQNLTTSRAVTQHVMDAVDVIVGSPQALPKPLEAMLFQSNASGTLASLFYLHDLHTSRTCRIISASPLW